MKLSRDEIISILEDVIENKPRLLDWDELISINHKDKFTKLCSDKLRDIEVRYPGRETGHLFSEEGVFKLKEILEDLKKD